MKIITIVGARPQFIKAAAVSRAVGAHNAEYQSSQINEIIVHTGQHYDHNMSGVFFEELGIPEPNFDLGVNSISHGAMTGQMLEKIEKILFAEKPDTVVVYGDTNSTLAGALAAVKLHIPVAHVEAGLRSFNLAMPEEINRIVADRLSYLLLCPTETAVNNLLAESITERVFNVGDVMYDVSLFFREKAAALHTLEKWKVSEKQYALCTIHRAENTDDKNRLKNIFAALQEITAEVPIVLPLHPRTRKMMSYHGLNQMLEGLQVIEPISYLEMIRLEMSAKAILTDSGGIQKEAFFYQVPCLTLREETEWIETVELGWNTLCGAEQEALLSSWQALIGQQARGAAAPYGKGEASENIISLLKTQ